MKGCGLIFYYPSSIQCLYFASFFSKEQASFLSICKIQAFISHFLFCTVKKMHFPASCPALLWQLQPCPFHITTVLWHQINLKSQCLNKLSRLIITLISLYSIKINNSSVSTLSEAMNYILHTSALSCSRIDSTTMSWSTTFALLIQIMFFTYIWHLLPDANSRCNKICCHANSSQNQAKSIESQSYPLQVFFYLVLETGPEYTAK